MSTNISKEDIADQIDVSLEDIRTLRDVLTNGFNFEELCNLTFYFLDVSYEEFPQTKEGFIRALIDYHKRRKELDWLAHAIINTRYESGDDHLIAETVRLWKKWGGRVLERIKVAIILVENLFDQFEEFKEELARHLGIESNEIKILKSALGSTHILISLPQRNAEALLETKITQISHKYSVDLVESFENLDEISQHAWFFAHAYGAHKQKEKQETPLVRWGELLEYAKQAGDKKEDIGEEITVTPANTQKDASLNWKCKLGFHKWVWDEAPIEASICEKYGHCANCGETKHVREHDFGWFAWFPDPENNCQMTRVCNRCGETETKEQETHDWQNWHYVQSNNCEEEGTCARCGNTSYRIVHKWDRREYASKTSIDCKIMYVCIRCDEKKVSDEEHHRWSETWVVDPAYKRWKRTCTRCSREQFGPVVS